MIPAKHHAEWLSLLEVSGPFLNLATLLRVFPQGLDEVEPARAAELRAAYEEWNAEARDARFHRAWVTYVLETVLEWDETVLAEGQAIPEPLQYKAVEQGGEVVRPDYILHERHQPNDVRAMVMVYPPEQDLEKAVARKLWSASPAVRMLMLLHTTGVRLGIVTNGEEWMLVNASKSGTAGYISWYAELWNEERLTLRAFCSMLTARRFFGVADEDTLAAMLDESANDAQEVTDQLGAQVRHAVEILVRALDRADQDHRGALLADVSESRLYEAALTVMMRLVFLLSAEERGLFLLGDPLYDQNYAISTLRAQLHEAADRTGEEVLERRSDAWSRLLATFRLVYHGSAHEDLKLAAYGGSLFDPERFPFLEGRSIGNPPAVDNRTVLHLLDALQILQTRGEARRLSFRALDIEQIGHVYEGLLDHEARRANEVILGFAGGIEPEIPLSALETQSNIARFLKEETGRGESAIKNALKKPLDGDRLPRLHVACGSDEALFKAVMPYLNLLRDDEFGYPVVILPGSVFVTAGSERRATGTHYTPRSLTEPIVEHTLEPLAYRGVAEGAAREDWQLKAPRELLALKVCDMAMGSGAFLVQVCRYLAARLMEQWDVLLSPLADEQGTMPIPRLTIYGESPAGALGEILIPDDPDERRTLALRLVADRCLYGVDKNPLAVEMAKLSLWLTTLAKGRPFTFLDHALKCGDSLVGVSLQQLSDWDLETGDQPKQVLLGVARIRGQIDEVVSLRQQLESFPVNTIDDQREKMRLLNEAEAKTHDLRWAANLLLASYFNDYKAPEQKAMRGHLLEVVQKGSDVPEGYYTPVDAVEKLPPFHWELEFPEVFLRENGGFDGFVGNPPFMGGKKITAKFGEPYRQYIVEQLSYHVRGESIDICAYFFVRAYNNLGLQGTLGLIATNTISQGDTREASLANVLRLGGTIYRGSNSLPWPGTAAVIVTIVHIYKGAWGGIFILDDKSVSTITSFLDDSSILGNPYRLAANAGRSFQGSIVLGKGFMLESQEAEHLLNQDVRNYDVIFPYLNGEDLNSRPDQSPSRWVINFQDWTEEQAMEYWDCYNILRERVKPQRDKVNRKVYREIWWQYAEKQKSLYSAIAPLRRVLAVAQTSRTLAFAFCKTDLVFSNAVILLVLDQDSLFAMLQSNIHVSWVLKYVSTLKGDTRYIPTDCFETFPFPPAEALAPLEDIGATYHETRRQIMLHRQEGLTTTYNRFHDPAEKRADIQGLRDLHRQMDEAVARAYGWDDLALAHDFHETAQGVRYTISEAARREVLKRLLALNFERYEEEQRLGLGVSGKKGKRKKSSPPAPSPLRSEGEEETDDDLNAPPPEQPGFWDDDTPKQKRLL